MSKDLMMTSLTKLSRSLGAESMGDSPVGLHGKHAVRLQQNDHDELA